MKTDFKTPPCCKSPDVRVMDYLVYAKAWDCLSPASPRVNRHCMTCGTHWIGRPNRVRQFGRREWDATFDLDAAKERRETKAWRDAERVKMLESTLDELISLSVLSADYWDRDAFDRWCAVLATVCPACTPVHGRG